MKLAARALAALAVTLAAALGGCALADGAGPASVAGALSGSVTTGVEQARSDLAASLVPAQEIPTLKTAGRLTVGVRTTSGCPAAFTGRDGELEGYYVDFASALAEEMGLRVTFVSVSGVDAALSDSVDVVLGVRSGESAVATVVAPFEDEGVGLFGTDVDGVPDASSFAGATVGVQESSSSLRALESTNLAVATKTYANVNAAFDALAAGEVDYVLCDVNSGGYLSTFYDGVSLAGTIASPTREGVAVLSSDQALESAVDEAYATLESNGRLEAIRARWFGTGDRLGEDSVVGGVETSDGGAAASAATDDESVSSTGSARDGSTAGANAAQPSAAAQSGAQ
jgi:ABC-type amino acid transport substrate-binding protein